MSQPVTVSNLTVKQIVSSQLARWLFNKNIKSGERESQQSEETDDYLLCDHMFRLVESHAMCNLQSWPQVDDD